MAFQPAGEVHPHNTLFKEGGQLHEVRSLCMNCHQNGTTKLLLTKIPHFRDVLVSSFECLHCNYKENNVQSTAELAPTAIRYELTVDPLREDPETVARDMNRQIVRSETASIFIPELDFEIGAKRAEINTVEGMLRNIRESLTAGQEERRTRQPDAYEKLEAFIRKVAILEDGKDAFTLVVDDLAGNSYIENPVAPARDPRCVVRKRQRTRDETIALGFAPVDDEADGSGGADAAGGGGGAAGHEHKMEGAAAPPVAVGRGDGYKSGGSKAALNVMAATLANKRPLARFEAIVAERDLQTARFEGKCHECGDRNETRACLFELPYFGRTVVMCTDCAACGFRHAEVKPGEGVADRAVRIELRVTTKEDLTRDVLKSDYAAILLPGLQLESEHGTLGGKFSTVEGLLQDVREQLGGSKQFATGDSADSDARRRYEDVLAALEGCLEVREPFVFVVDDPSGASFIEGRANGVPDSDPLQDAMLSVVRYTRSAAQDDALGLTGMNTEDYCIPEEGDEDAESSGEDGPAAAEAGRRGSGSNGSESDDDVDAASGDGEESKTAEGER